MIRLVLFDIDGTLLRTGGVGIKAFAKAFSTEFGVHEGADKLKFSGRTDVSLTREVFMMNQIDPSRANFDRFFAAYIGWLKKMIVDCDGGVGTTKTVGCSVVGVTVCEEMRRTKSMLNSTKCSPSAIRL